METVNTLLKCLKSKRIIDDPKKAEKETASEQIELRKPDDLFIRDAITGLGTILKEDLENHFYITSVKTGAFGGALSYAIIVREEASAVITVYAHEGLIKQNLSEKTMNILKKVLC